MMEFGEVFNGFEKGKSTTKKISSDRALLQILLVLLVVSVELNYQRNKDKEGRPVRNHNVGTAFWFTEPCTGAKGKYCSDIFMLV